MIDSPARLRDQANGNRRQADLRAHALRAGYGHLISGPELDRLLRRDAPLDT